MYRHLFPREALSRSLQSTELSSLWYHSFPLDTYIVHTAVPMSALLSQLVPPSPPCQVHESILLHLRLYSCPANRFTVGFQNCCTTPKIRWFPMYVFVKWGRGGKIEQTSKATVLICCLGYVPVFTLFF